MISKLFFGLVLTSGVAASAEDFRYGQPAQAKRDANLYVPDLTAMMQPQSSELRELVERFVEDRAVLDKFYSVPGSTVRLQRFAEFYAAWQKSLEAMPYDQLGVDGRIDWHLMKLQLRYEAALIAREQQRAAEMAAFMGFADDIAQLQEARRQFEKVQPQAAAATLAKMRRAIEASRQALEADGEKPSKIVAYRAAARIGELGRSLENWFLHYDGYDPQFGWWTRAPYQKLKEVMADYAKFLREKVVGIKPGEDEPIVGDPIGTAGLAMDLEHEMIPYSPEELIAIAEKEFAWCQAEWKKVSAEMGKGDDWKAALEQIKDTYVPPGEQPALIAKQAYEAIDFLLKRDVITIPPLAIDDWLMTMMSPERQKVAPFFLGGDRIIVSFPTDTMDHHEKLDSLRANNPHFCRAVVHHELIPGHHLQGWYLDRYNQHRQLFYTPFWMEGWALWWEFHLWDLGFANTAENKAGMLFWRSHRAARIIFSLNFHLGKWTPEQCIDFLVEKVGHDRHTATGEVRRSFNGDYSPLYQAAYMMGAIQLRALYAEAVTSGKMSEKEFHDRIMKGGSMPIEMVRADVLGLKLPKDYRSSWKFADPR
jgi:uncharacterized protein (DUF885 family)